MKNYITKFVNKMLFSWKIGCFLSFLLLFINNFVMRWIFFLYSVLANKKIIVISRIQHLGDIIAIEPLIRSIRKENPLSIIVMVVNYKYRCLVKYNPDIDHILYVSSLKNWMEIKSFCQKINVCIFDCHFDKERCDFTGDVLSNPTAAHINYKNYYNYGNLLTVFSKVAGWNIVEDTTPIVYSPKSYNDRVKAFLKKNSINSPYIVCHFSSNMDERSFLLKREKVIKAIIQETGYYVVEIGLRSLPELFEVRRRYFSSFGIFNPLELWHLIKGADVFLGVDSGPAHIANAAGTFSIILLGAFGAFSSNYMPFSGRFKEGIDSIMIRSPYGNVNNIEVTTIIQAIKKDGYQNAKSKCNNTSI